MVYVCFKGKDYLVRKAGKGFFIANVYEPICNSVQTNFPDSIIAWPYSPFTGNRTHDGSIPRISLNSFV